MPRRASGYRVPPGSARRPRLHSRSPELVRSSDNSRNFLLPQRKSGGGDACRAARATRVALVILLQRLRGVLQKIGGLPSIVVVPLIDCAIGRNDAGAQ